MAKRSSFFERLTGAVRLDEEATEIEEETSRSPVVRALNVPAQKSSSWIEENADEEGELAVDVYQNQDTIFVKAMLAGVRPDDLDVSISRDMITIRGKREEERTSTNDDYFVRELYWGSFSRSITLPEEIDVDEAEAIEKHGLLILRLPKLDKKRQSKLKVKTV
ncbi:MAG: Hsp20/alpha crystallin family protein [Patescibacteria group bacterium]|nr:Hsp20/alpha crystallin family protein [Patescibacteria group bacterium]